MHDHVGGRDANHNQPVATASGTADRAPVQVAAGDGDAGRDLLLQRGEARLAGEASLDAVAGQGPDLSRCVGGVAELAHPGQVLVVTIRPGEDAGLEESQEHGAAGGEAHPPCLIGGRIQLGEPGDRERIAAAGCIGRRRCR